MSISLAYHVNCQYELWFHYLCVKPFVGSIIVGSIQKEPSDLTGALPCCLSALKYSITFCGSGNIGKQWLSDSHSVAPFHYKLSLLVINVPTHTWLSVDATRILCGVKKGRIVWGTTLYLHEKVKKNKQQISPLWRRIKFWSHILWYSAPFVFRKTTHVREMSVSYQMGQLEASCTKQPGHLLLTTSPRTRGQGGQGSRAAGQPGAVLDPQCPFPAVAFRSGWPRQLLSVGLTEEVVWFQNGVCMTLLGTGAWAVNTGNDVLSLSVTFQHQAAATLRVSLALVQHCVTQSHLTSTNVSCTLL